MARPQRSPQPPPHPGPSPALRQRTVLVSGASRGIGRAIASRLLEAGHRLSLGVRDPEAPEAWWASSPSIAGTAERLLIHPYDALAAEQSANSGETWVEATVARWGGVDAVVHSAGILSRVGVTYSTQEAGEIRQLLDVNLMGPWRLSRAAWPHLEASGDGRVLTLVSMSGKRVKGRLAAYGVSKFALMGLCQALRNEGWEAGIRVTAICPGWVNTAMAAAVTAVPPEAMTQPEDLADTVAHLLSLPAAAVPFELAVNCVLESGG
ncbi:SDR family NAD(P)-dependent oxidoreductase [Aphanothece stagnina]